MKNMQYFIAGDEQQSGVHDRCAVQHGGHEDIVTRAINERYMSKMVRGEGWQGKNSKRLGLSCWMIIKKLEKLCGNNRIREDIDSWCTENINFYLWIKIHISMVILIF